MSLFPLVSSTTVPFNSNVAFQNSWISVPNDKNVTLYAQAVYSVNNLGSNGFKIVTGNSPVTGNFSAFKTLSSTVFFSLTAANGLVINSGSGINSVTFPANFTIDGSYVAVQLSSGGVLAYNA